MINNALKQAKKSTFRQRMGAVIVKGGSIVSVGHNKTNYGSHSVGEKRWSNTLHAEADAIRKLLNVGGFHKLHGATIFISRIKKDGSIGSSYPCVYCKELIQAVGIRKIVFTDEFGITKQEKV